MEKKKKNNKCMSPAFVPSWWPTTYCWVDQQVGVLGAVLGAMTAIWRRVPNSKKLEMVDDGGLKELSSNSKLTQESLQVSGVAGHP